MKTKLYAAITVIGLLFSATGCTPDDDNAGNGIEPGQMDASFTITPKDGSANRFILTASSNEGTLAHFWNTGTGDASGSASHEIFLPDAGTYEITHTSAGIGGATVSTTQTLNVLTSDPNAGNIILGGKFETADDIAKWTTYTVNGEGNANWTFANGVATTTTTAAWAQKGLYQAIQVQAGKTYRFDMKVKGQGGFNNAFFELYADYATPVPNTDYTAGGKVLQINTWAGCGMNPFEGQLFNLSCGGSSDTSQGLKTFANSGTVYVVMRGGTEFATPGNPYSVTIDNVEVRRVN